VPAIAITWETKLRSSSEHSNIAKGSELIQHGNGRRKMAREAEMREIEAG
jgi:hypothetical protein